MDYITGTREFRLEEPTVVTIGKFDGRHKGHQKLLHEMLRIKREMGYRTAVFTFSMSPSVLTDQTAYTVITTNEERRNKLAGIGIDYLVEYPFTEHVSHMLPEDFIREILVKQMNAKAIVVGPDCGFGYKRAGNVALLAELSVQIGYDLIVIKKEKDVDREISSTYVREELDLGNMEKVNELLGEPYSICGIVVHGNHIGSTVLGFPTANILPPTTKHLPRFGVYFSRVLVHGRCYSGITNIGRKPTVKGEYPVGVETFIFQLQEDLYGSLIEVQPLHFIRPEQKFDTLEELKEQIAKDKIVGMKCQNDTKYDYNVTEM